MSDDESKERRIEQRFREEPGSLVMVISLDELKMLQGFDPRRAGRWFKKRLKDYMTLKVKQARARGELP